MIKRMLPIAIAALALAVPATTLASTSKLVPATATPVAASSKTIAPVHINTATVMQLETLPGIGPKIAAEIVKNRPYKDSKELETKVKGIGPKVWTQIEKYVLFR